jgi:glucose uptake protein GlcU
MGQESFWMMVGAVGTLVLGLLYGYWIGTIGKRRSWSFRRMKAFAGGPLLAIGLIMQIAALLVHERSGYRSAETWAKFPWTIVWATGIFAMMFAAKGAGVAWSDFIKNRDDNLSIR